MKQLTANQQKDIVDNFVHKLGARAKTTSRLVRRAQPYQYVPYDFTTDYTTNHYLETYEENIVEMELPLSSFQTLAEHANDLEELRARFGPNIDEMGQRIMMEDYRARQESLVRKNNPGVQKAWEKYQMMLKIAGG